MSVRVYVTLFCLAAGAGLALVGCGKKTGQSQPAPKPGAAQSAAAPQASVDVSAKVTTDLEKPVAEVQTQAQTLSVPDLKALATKYKDAISTKKEELQKVLTQVKEIPITEALGEKAKTLKTEVEKIQATIKDLTDRFQVYYNQLKAKGADLSGLAI